MPQTGRSIPPALARRAPPLALCEAQGWPRVAGQDDGVPPCAKIRATAHVNLTLCIVGADGGYFASATQQNGLREMHFACASPRSLPVSVQVVRLSGHETSNL